MKIKVLIIQFLMISMVTSCEPHIFSTFPTSTSVPQITATQNILLHTLTPLPQNTVTQDNSNTSIEKCKNFPETPLNGSGFLIAGNLVTNDNYQIFDMRTMKAFPLFENYTDLAVSPGSNALAYTNDKADPGQLIVITELGKTRISRNGWINYPESYISRWANNNTLIFAQGLAPGTSLIFLNPFSGATKSFNPNANLHDIYNLLSDSTWGGDTLVVFSSSLQYYVYPEMSSEDVELALMRASDQTLVTKIKPTLIAARPEWSPTSDSFAIAKPLSVNQHGFPEGDDLFRVKVDGEIERLTDLSTLYPHLLINSYKWSPDGEHIAFWFTPDQSNHNFPVYLAVFNVSSQ